jgi:histone-lysine N-methyltransferase SETMAR
MIMCLHSVAATNEAIRQLKFELLPHPPYSLDLAPSDYHMFGPTKKPCMDKDLPVLMKLRTQCIRGFDEN